MPLLPDFELPVPDIFSNLPFTVKDPLFSLDRFSMKPIWKLQVAQNTFLPSPPFHQIVIFNLSDMEKLFLVETSSKEFNVKGKIIEVKSLIET